ncbi:MAG: arsenate reductase ArsC [Abditibacteriales bacterium]|nr:arsenate reductase ArsC [Abditibacteriales bacterium]MDW8366650.1 arsenate reductase ArsC [Abditibacteriales bacterium]
MRSHPRILFLCTANSCRSQMAEGFARHFGSDKVEVYSAGTHPTTVNPTAIEVMREKGVDISAHTAKGLGAVPKDVDFVITLCGDAAESCPVYPAHVRVEHWNLPDPAKATGTREEVLRVFREVRDTIEKRVKEWIEGLRVES